MIQNSYDGKPTLFLVPTPIGNMGDITYRAVNVLKEVDLVFSEDTRITSNLLNYLNIKKRLISLHKFNEENVKKTVLKALQNGNNIALVTDRGSPIISDPGYETVKFVSSFGFNVVALPGATALIPAISVSGIPSNHFLFYGFLDSKSNHRIHELQTLKSNKNTIIFYEAPHRIKNMLEDLENIFGNRNISISREISKKFETVYRGKILDVKDQIIEKGEFVIVVEGNKENDMDVDCSVKDLVNYYISIGYKKMDAIKEVASLRQKGKSEIYKIYHQEEE